MDQYIGKMLDNRYEILETIGVGGMAVVYRAYCHRLKRFVAIKILKRELAADAEFRRRFHDEAQAVAMLSHPNIVAVYDISRGDEIDYIVMELIEGITLKQYMEKKEGVINWKESLYFITQIVRALGHAHSRGIIHRDIKPQNIMVLRDGTVKVADFGIARIMTAAQKTMTQEALGSVHYISPEQARGSHIDARADIYSAGVVLYEMLTGRLPFDGDTPVAVALQHINATPLSPTEIDPEIPVGLEEITMKAMASRIDQRYLNAEAMLMDLEEFRKNPRVVFRYDLQSFHGVQPVPDDSTKKLGDTGELARQRVRTRPAQPRRRVQESEYEEDEEDDGRRRLVVPIVIVVCLVGVALFLWLAFFSGLFNRTEELEVPNLVGQVYNDVLANEELMGNFKIVLEGQQSSEEIEAGKIISQDPVGGPGNMAQKGSIIRVVVSTGKQEPEPIVMIDVTNYQEVDATRDIRQLGLELDGNTEYQPSDDVEKGRVISFKPDQGTKLMPGDTVHLVVSTGPKPVVVPQLTGVSIDRAEAMLAELGLSVGSVRNVDSDKPKGQVVYQSVAIGKEVNKGTAVTLHVSLGPKPPQEPVTKEKEITVPLPEDKETVEVRITVGGAEVYKETVNTSAGELKRPVSYTEGQEICVYVDGALVSQE